MAAERNGRREDLVEAGLVAPRERAQRRGCGGRDGVEDAKQRIGMVAAVAGDELGVVEVVAGIHAHTLGQAPAHDDLFLLGQ